MSNPDVDVLPITVGRKPRRFGWLRSFVLHLLAPGLSHVPAYGSVVGMLQFQASQFAVASRIFPQRTRSLALKRRSARMAQTRKIGRPTIPRMVGLLSLDLEWCAIKMQNEHRYE